MDMEQEMQRLQYIEGQYNKLLNTRPSLRDKFALAALPALVNVKCALDLDHVKWDAAAEHAYLIADAMLREREQ